MRASVVERERVGLFLNFSSKFNHGQLCFNLFLVVMNISAQRNETQPEIICGLSLNEE